MTHTAALPFKIKRNSDVIGATEITSTHETVHGLIRLEGDHIRVQWRTSRSIERVGWGIRTDNELEPVRETIVPLGAFANAEVQRELRELVSRVAV